jgi:hypothetical protein
MIRLLVPPPGGLSSLHHSPGRAPIDGAPVHALRGLAEDEPALRATAVARQVEEVAARAASCADDDGAAPDVQARAGIVAATAHQRDLRADPDE